MAKSNIYDSRLAANPSTNVISVEADEFGTVKRQWSWNLRGNGGLVNEQTDLLGKHISDLDGFQIRPKYEEM